MTCICIFNQLFLYSSTSYEYSSCIVTQDTMHELAPPTSNRVDSLSVSVPDVIHLLDIRLIHLMFQVDPVWESCATGLDTSLYSRSTLPAATWCEHVMYDCILYVTSDIFW